MRKISVFIFLMVVVLIISGCNLPSNILGNEIGSISGIVKDSNNNPINDVKIKVGNNTSHTDTDGIFKIENIVIGDHIISFIKESYEEKNLAVNIEAGNNSLGTIVLEKQNINIAEKPKILSVELSSTEVSDGTEIYVTIRVESNALVDWLNSRFVGPNGVIDAGGSSVEFIEVEPNIWEYSWTDKVSQYAPNGKYYYTDISVENEGELESEVWPNELSIEIINNYQAEKPQILSVDLSSTEVSDGTEINVIIRVESNVPVDWLNSRFVGPNGVIDAGGSSAEFIEVEPNIWEHSWTDKISQYAPNGKYYYTDISVENEGELESEDWPNEVSVEIINDFQAEKPQILSVELSSTEVSDGTKIDVTIRVESNAPVDFLSSSFYGPNGNIYGGGRSAEFIEVEPNIWEHSWTDIVSQYAPSGKYSYTDISVENEGALESEDWPNEVSIEIINDFQAEKPQILSVELSSTKVSDGTEIDVTIRVESNAPIVFLSSCFYGPNGNIYGGGRSTEFVEVEPNIWEHSWTDIVSQYAPSGKYYYTDISVENEGALESEDWPNEVSLMIIHD